MSKRNRRMNAEQFRERIMSIPPPPALLEAIMNARGGRNLPEQMPMPTSEDRRKYALGCAMTLAMADRIGGADVVAMSRDISPFLDGD